MLEIFESITPPVRADDVGKLAVGPRKAEKLHPHVRFSAWEAILAEVIVGDAFGADRMDYLLRDSLHLGVAYGRFDYERLIGTLRVIPEPAREAAEPDEAATDPVLGCELGGLQAAEQLLLARYFMFSQVYHHHTAWPTTSTSRTSSRPGCPAASSRSTSRATCRATTPTCCSRSSRPPPTRPTPRTSRPVGS